MNTFCFPAMLTIGLMLAGAAAAGPSGSLSQEVVPKDMAAFANEGSTDEYRDTAQMLGEEKPNTFGEAAHEAAVGLQGYPYSKKIGWFVPQEPTWGSVYDDPGWRKTEGNDRWFAGFLNDSWTSGYIDMWIQATLVETLVNYDWISGDSLKNSIPLKVVYDFWSKKSLAFKKVHNDLFDDKLWWVMMYLRLHEVFDDVKYVKEAEEWWDRAIMNPEKRKWNAWDDSLCGGGVRWGDKWEDEVDANTYHNAVTNGLFLTVSARLAAHYYLHNNREKADKYAYWAQKEWQWLTEGTGKLLWKSESEPLLIDGISQKTPQSAVTKTTDLYTYNQGLIIYGMASLARMYFNKGETGKVQDISDRIDEVFQALVDSGDLSTTVINKKTGDPMRVLWDSSRRGKVTDLVAFKGCTVRHLMSTLQLMRKLNPKGRFAERAPAWFKDQATAIMQNDMDHPDGGRPEYNPWYFGFNWQGPSMDTVMAATQAGALDSFNAALWVKQGFPLPPARLFK